MQLDYEGETKANRNKHINKPMVVIMNKSHPTHHYLILSTTLVCASIFGLPLADAMKHIVFLRHGCTYMNEHLGNSVSFGAPGFTDIFPPKECEQFFLDSPLSPYGVRQATQLGRIKPPFTDELDLVVVSPLTRALQTLDMGVKPHLPDHIPILALPYAAERLYLISDVGRPVHELKSRFHYVDFDTAMSIHDHWWYQPDETHQEWRPVGQRQAYATPGEPQHHFDRRMTKLYRWLRDRPERNICVVCHHGVIDWMLDMDFDNCQWRRVAFSSIQPRALQNVQ